MPSFGTKPCFQFRLPLFCFSMNTKLWSGRKLDVFSTQLTRNKLKMRTSKCENDQILTYLWHYFLGEAQSLGPVCGVVRGVDCMNKSWIVMNPLYASSQQMNWPTSNLCLQGHQIGTDRKGQLREVGDWKQGIHLSNKTSLCRAMTWQRDPSKFDTEQRVDNTNEA